MMAGIEPARCIGSLRAFPTASNLPLAALPTELHHHQTGPVLISGMKCHVPTWLVVGATSTRVRVHVRASACAFRFDDDTASSSASSIPHHCWFSASRLIFSYAVMVGYLMLWAASMARANVQRSNHSLPPLVNFSCSLPILPICSSVSGSRRGCGLV